MLPDFTVWNMMTPCRNYTSHYWKLFHIWTRQKAEAECLNYIQTTVHNRYRFLCRGCLSVPQSESIEDSIDTLSAPSPFDESYYDICNYIKTLPEKGMRRQIMSLFFFQYKTDSEIAEILHVSRQYVNRIKKQMITGYFSER